MDESKHEIDLNEKFSEVHIDEDSDKISKNVKNDFCNKTKSSLAENSFQNDKNSTKLSNGISSSSDCNHEELQNDKPNDGEKKEEDFSQIKPYLKCTLTPFECESIQISRDDEIFKITYKVYESELELPSIMKLIQKDLSEVKIILFLSVKTFHLFIVIQNFLFSRTQSTLIDISYIIGQSFVTWRCTVTFVLDASCAS